MNAIGAEGWELANIVWRPKSGAGWRKDWGDALAFCIFKRRVANTTDLTSERGARCRHSCASGCGGASLVGLFSACAAAHQPPHVAQPSGLKAPNCARPPRGSNDGHELLAVRQDLHDLGRAEAGLGKSRCLRGTSYRHPCARQLSACGPPARSMCWSRSAVGK